MTTRSDSTCPAAAGEEDDADANDIDAAELANALADDDISREDVCFLVSLHSASLSHNQQVLAILQRFGVLSPAASFSSSLSTMRMSRSTFSAAVSHVLQSKVRIKSDQSVSFFTLPGRPQCSH